MILAELDFSNSDYLENESKKKVIKLKKEDELYTDSYHNSFFEFLSTFHQILDFFIAKLLSDLQINTSLEKNSKLAKNNRGKKQKKN